MSDVLADVVRLRNALAVLREGEAQESGSDPTQEDARNRDGHRSGSDPDSGS
jgi:hypothetical protein